jgi:hypothetical protein
VRDIQKLPAWSGDGYRAETGPMQFGEDWPGVFIRGDDALVFAMMCPRVPELQQLLRSCRVKEPT